VPHLVIASVWARRPDPSLKGLMVQSRRSPRGPGRLTLLSLQNEANNVSICVIVVRPTERKIFPALFLTFGRNPMLDMGSHCFPQSLLASIRIFRGSLSSSIRLCRRSLLASIRMFRRSVITSIRVFPRFVLASVRLFRRSLIASIRRFHR
jgi:hypothetical protein